MTIQRWNGLWITAVFSAAACLAASSTALIDAARDKDKAAFKTLLAQKADARATTPDGTTALHWAAHWGDLEMVDALLKAGADVKAQNRYGVTPLAEAVQNGGAVLIERLLKAGADPNTLTTPEGETVLMTASRVGNIDAVRVLLDHGANVNAKESYKGQTALMWAAAEGHPDVIKLLIAKGADVNAMSDSRDTTLPKLPAGSPVAPVARGGLTALSFAARQGEIESVKALLDAGANINQVDVDGNNALQFAILNTHYDLAMYLIDRGADPNVVNKEGRGALYMAIDMRDADKSPRPARQENDKSTSLDVIKALIAHGANVNQQLKSTAEIHRFAQDHGDKTLGEGATPFMRAARSADFTVMRLLLDKGADPKIAQKDGLTALLVAAGVGWSEKIKGTEEEALETVKLCVDLGMDLNAVSDRGDTAMHGAAMRGANSIIRYLAEKGVKLDAKNKQGLTPLDIASGKGGFQPGAREPKPATMALLRELLAKNPGPTAQAAEPKPAAAN
jgi:ankyrin repeat protein